jgi:hypothetical protein
MSRLFGASIIAAMLLVSFLLGTAGGLDNGVSVSRKISVSEGGLLYVWDQISGLGPGAELRLGIPDRLHQYLEDIWAEGGVIVDLGLGEAGDTRLYRVEAVSDAVIVRHVYAGAVSAPSAGTYSISAPSTPILEGVEYSASVEIILPEDARVDRPPQGYTLNEARLILTGYTSDQRPQRTVSFSFSSNRIALIKAERAEILYDEEAQMVTAWFRIRSIDARNLQSLSLRLPDGLRVVEAGDNTGQIDSRQSGQTVTVNFYPQRYELLSGWRYRFYVKALLVGGQEILSRAGDTLYVRILNPLNATVDELTVRIALPRGVDVKDPESFREVYRDDAGKLIVSLSVPRSGLYRGYTQAVTLEARGLPIRLPQILLAAFIVAAVVGAVTYVRARPAGTRPERIEAVEPTVRRLVKDLGELRTLLEELDGILNLTRGDVKKIQIQPNVSRIRSRLDDVVETAKAIALDERYARIVRDLQLSRERSGETLKLMQRNFLELQRGELSRPAYLKIYRSLRTDLRGLVTKVGEAEQSLKRLVQK